MLCLDLVGKKYSTHKLVEHDLQDFSCSCLSFAYRLLEKSMEQQGRSQWQELKLFLSQQLKHWQGNPYMQGAKILEVQMNFEETGCTFSKWVTTWRHHWPWGQIQTIWYHDISVFDVWIWSHCSTSCCPRFSLMKVSSTDNHPLNGEIYYQTQKHRWVTA